MTGTEVLLVILNELMDKDVQSFTDLRNAASVNQGTLAKHLKHLQDKGFVIKDGEGRYRTGEVFLKYRLKGNSSHPCLPEIKNLLNRLGTKWGATFLYLDFTQSRMDCLAKFVPENGINMQYVGASRMNFLYNPWGIVYLALRQEQGGNPEKMRPFCRPSPPGQKHPHPYTREELQEQLDLLEKTGYADDGEGSNGGIRRLAFPFSRGGKIIGAVGCGILEGSTSERDIEEMIKDIKGQTAPGESNE